MALTSRVKERTTSDLVSAFSSSCPMSMMDVLWPLFNFCSLKSPPLDTGMLSRFAISRFTEARSSSTYVTSISLDKNLGNLPPCWKKRTRMQPYLQIHVNESIFQDKLEMPLCIRASTLDTGKGSVLKIHNRGKCRFDFLGFDDAPLIHNVIFHPSILTRAIWSAICSRPSSSLLIWAACSSRLSN